MDVFLLRARQTKGLSMLETVEKGPAKAINTIVLLYRAGENVLNPFKKRKDRKDQSNQRIEEGKGVKEKYTSVDPRNKKSSFLSSGLRKPSDPVFLDHTVELGIEDMEFLRNDWAALDTLRPGLTSDVIEFIRTGGRREALQALRHPESKDVIAASPREGSVLRKKYFHTTTQRDPMYFLRLAFLYNDIAETVGIVPLHWLDRFFHEIGSLEYMKGPYHPLPFSIIVRMNELRGRKLDEILHLCFRRPGEKVWQGTALTGFPDFAREHRKYVVDSILGKDIPVKKRITELIRHGRLPLDDFWEPLAQLAQWALTYGFADPQAKGTRGQNELIDYHLHFLYEGIIPALQRKALHGDRGERSKAIHFLDEITSQNYDFNKRFMEPGQKTGITTPLAFFRMLMQRETDEYVKRVLEQRITKILPEVDSLNPQHQSVFNLPPIPEPDPLTPPPESVRESLMQMFQEFNRIIRELNLNNESRGSFDHDTQIITNEQMESAYNSLGHLTGIHAYVPFRFNLDRWSFRGKLSKLIRPVLQNKEIELIHVIRLIWIINKADNAYYSIFSFAVEYYRRYHGYSFDLRELAATMEAVGWEGNHLLAIGQNPNWEKPEDGVFVWDESAIWPYYAERIFLLEKPILGIKDPEIKYPPRVEPRELVRALLILGAFPEPPGHLHKRLWALALGKVKRYRLPAQSCLNKLPDIIDLLLERFSSSKKEPFLILVKWIGEIGQLKNGGKAVGILTERLTGERDPITRVTLMEALENMGVPSEQLLNPDSMMREAAAAMKKNIPKDLEWFPFQQLPSVSWENTGDFVDPVIIQWLIIQSYHLKSPEPISLFQRYEALFVRRDREILGRFVLENWISRDSVTLSRQDAEDMVFTNYRLTDRSKLENPTFQGLINEQMKSTVYTATGEQGILAVSSAFCSSDVVPQISQYISKWYGYKWRQCVALVDVLAWIASPLAIQYLLKIADKFRTKSIREEAAKQVKLLADRKGWTVDELGDRTIPRGGFDEDRELVLDTGKRTLTARLEPNFKVKLFNQDGKEIKSFPAPRAGEDEKRVKEEKKAFTEAKRTVKTTVKEQTNRLYEALCTQRTWASKDWQTYLLTHPIMGILCRRLVWDMIAKKEKQEDDIDSEIVTFRPMEDGSLTDVNDDEVPFKTDAFIRLAHSSNSCTGAEAGKGWKNHFKDYRVSPLFEQFPTSSYTLPEQMREDFEIEDFLGHVVHARILRREAKKLGYIKGSEDEKWFYEYRKKLPNLRLEVNLGFSGYASWDEDTNVALKKLFFTRLPEKAGEGREANPDDVENAVKLEDVPPVLLSEAWGHMRIISEMGTGYDPEWLKHTGYN